MTTRSSASAADYVPAGAGLTELREASSTCRGCALYERATQTVFGEGGPAALMVVGEQPGDAEDRAGTPFVGPAGRLLDHCLERSGIDRRDVYVTNAVKHFKWEQRGKRRLHKKPSAREVRACFPWLEAEIEAVKPEVVLCLGATAAQSILGPATRVGEMRGELVLGPFSTLVAVTIHPSAILRVREAQDREREEDRFVEDLSRVAGHLAASGSS